MDGAGNSVLASSASVFKTVGYGYHYLADGSVLRDAGVANINPTLAAEFKKRPTFAPIPLPIIKTNLTLLTKRSAIPDRRMWAGIMRPWIITPPQPW